MQIVDICRAGRRHAEAVGFDLGDHVAQLLMIADEVAEALAHVETMQEDGSSLGTELKRFGNLFLRIGSLRRAGDYRKTPSRIADDQELTEELADIVIRVCTYAAANHLDLQEAVAAKLRKNEGRLEARHGKSF